MSANTAIGEPSGARRAAALALPIRLARLALRRVRNWGPQVTSALLLLASCAIGYGYAIVPAQLRLAHLRAAAAAPQLRAHAASPPTLSGPALLYARLRPEGTFPDAMEQLLSNAQGAGLILNQGDYKVSRESMGKLVRYQIILPLRAEYPQVRRFLSALTTEIPGLALEDIQFERHKLGEPMLDVKLKLVLFMGPAR